MAPGTNTAKGGNVADPHSTPTPETDQEHSEMRKIHRESVVPANFARKLERERDAARAALLEAVNIGLAALGHYNTERTDEHWNDRERQLRNIERKYRLPAAPKDEEKP